MSVMRIEILVCYGDPHYLEKVFIRYVPEGESENRFYKFIRALFWGFRGRQSHRLRLSTELRLSL